MRWLLALLCVCTVAGGAVADTADGATLFGDNRRETLRAMKMVQRSLGLRSCLHCHVKKSGKVQYEVDTPNKVIARQMFHAFVDTLARTGTATLSFAHAVNDTTTIQRMVSAKRTSTQAGDQLSITVTDPAPADGQPAPSSTKVVAAPAAGEPLMCGTCHDGALHFVTGSH